MLDVLVASDDRARMDMPDNLALAPDGTLWFAEDGPGHDCVRCVRADGRVVTLARNVAEYTQIIVTDRSTLTARWARIPPHASRGRPT